MDIVPKGTKHYFIDKDLLPTAKQIEDLHQQVDHDVARCEDGFKHDISEIEKIEEIFLLAHIRDNPLFDPKLCAFLYELRLRTSQLVWGGSWERSVIQEVADKDGDYTAVYGVSSLKFPRLRPGAQLTKEHVEPLMEYDEKLNSILAIQLALSQGPTPQGFQVALVHSGVTGSILEPSEVENIIKNHRAYTLQSEDGEEKTFPLEPAKFILITKDFLRAHRFVSEVENSQAILVGGVFNPRLKAIRTCVCYEDIFGMFGIPARQPSPLPPAAQAEIMAGAHLGLQ